MLLLVSTIKDHMVFFFNSPSQRQKGSNISLQLLAVASRCAVLFVEFVGRVFIFEFVLMFVRVT